MLPSTHVAGGERAEAEERNQKEWFMKRVMLWIVGAGITSVALTVALQAQERPAATKPAPADAPVAVSPSTQEKPAFTFTNDAQMREFGQLMQKRQAVVTRMAVLQAYFENEQESLKKLNEDLLNKYHLDTNKNYRLDPSRKVILEQPEEPAAESSEPSKAPASAASH